MLDRYGLDLTKGAYEIVRGFGDTMPPIDYFLKTLILFNAKGFDPPHVFIDFRDDFGWWLPRHDNGVLVGLITGHGEDVLMKSKFVPKITLKNIEDLRESCNPSFLLLEGKDEEIKKVPISEMKSFLAQFGVKQIRGAKEAISAFLTNVTLHTINTWTEKTIGRRFKSQEELEQELNSGYCRVEDIEVAQKYFPEYIKDMNPQNDCMVIDIFENPPWKSENKLLDLQRLKIELAYLYLSKLPAKHRVEVLKSFVSFLGFEIFDSKGFRGVVKEWETSLLYNEKIKIRSILKSLEDFFAISESKKRRTNRDYVLLCLKVIKIIINDNSPIEQAIKARLKITHACEVVSKNFKKEKFKLSLKSNLE